MDDKQFLKVYSASLAIREKYKYLLFLRHGRVVLPRLTRTLIFFFATASQVSELECAITHC